MLPAQVPAPTTAAPTVVVEAADSLPLWLQGAVALATVIAAGAAWRSAAAASRAAKASEVTNRDALEALAVGIRPWVFIDYGHDADKPFGFMIRNDSLFDAANVQVEVHRLDGQTVSTPAERVASGATLIALAGEVTDESPAGMLATFHDVVVMFSDYRGLARYESRLRWSPGEPPEPVQFERSHERIR